MIVKETSYQQYHSELNQNRWYFDKIKCFSKAYSHVSNIQDFPLINFFHFLSSSPTLFSTPCLLILQTFTSLPFYARLLVYKFMCTVSSSSVKPRQSHKTFWYTCFFPVYFFGWNFPAFLFILPFLLFETQQYDLGLLFLKKKKLLYVLAVACTDSSLVSLAQKWWVLEVLPNFSFRTTRLQLNLLILIEFPNIFH